MLLEVLLYLRRDEAPVAVIQQEGHSRPELGTAYPFEDVRRATLPTLWGMDSHPTRVEPPATIDVPLPQRTQTVLSYRVPVATQQALRGDPTPPPTGRRHRLTLDLRL